MNIVPDMKKQRPRLRQGCRKPLTTLFQSSSEMNLMKTTINGKTQIILHAFAFQYDVKQYLAWEKRMRASNLARNNIMLQRRNSINSG